MKATRPNRSRKTSGTGGHTTPAGGRRRFLAVGGVLAGGAMAASGGAMSGAGASVLGGATGDGRPSTPTAHQRLYYEKARF